MGASRWRRRAAHGCTPLGGRRRSSTLSNSVRVLWLAQMSPLISLRYTIVSTMVRSSASVYASVWCCRLVGRLEAGA